jgi:predicted DNA repair protein MutK
MAGTSLLTLIDDIASILDDVAVMSKVAAKKTAGVLGDDLALNAQQVSGVTADRELPVVWAVAIGSFKNKFILVPTAIAISTFIPWAVTPLLMLGGAFLCYEGFEKLAHKLMQNKTEIDIHHTEHVEALVNRGVNMAHFEKDKIKGAIRTDFILSAEIIVITLGTVATESIWKQLAVLTTIAIIMTVGVYGLVAGIVKLDDGGIYLSQKNGNSLFRKTQRCIGSAILKIAPYLMKSLSIVGTVAMFMVGGGILIHGIFGASEQIHNLAPTSNGIIGSIVNIGAPVLFNVLTGIVAGAAVLLGVTATKRIFLMVK